MHSKTKYFSPDNHVASGSISKELLHQILTAIIDGTFNSDEALKLDIYGAISGGQDT
jgi:death-on-curing protein